MWCVSAFIPNKNALQAINTLQAQLTMWALRLGKRSSESWVEFRVRSFRAARYCISAHHKDRWSTMWLRRCWLYCGHRARGAQWHPIPGSTLLDRFRDLTWWQNQQLSRTGLRHPRRFYPKLMNDERSLNAAAGGPCMERRGPGPDGVGGASREVGGDAGLALGVV